MADGMSLHLKNPDEALDHPDGAGVAGLYPECLPTEASSDASGGSVTSSAEAPPHTLYFLLPLSPCSGHLALRILSISVGSSVTGGS